ncbi:Signal transduction histidine kinase [Pseudonocardia ammonioxydans]|uniref:histidine kinase n=1 Tax=Pseudonocardia ammonioxydans TaxID=260086 RepID=A0A1I5A9Z4_PSUAM|nr:histidine kinase [Pseudonocardia ammonioxydans]SFN59150.1 Signal transduction histidine kinase [Pseudonocardia ammonioxydans]
MPAADAPGPVPGSRAGDAALAAGVFLMAMVEVVGTVTTAAPLLHPTATGAVSVAAGIVLAGAQAGLVLLRRFRPRRAYALLPVVAVTEFWAIGAFASYAWPVLAFAVARAPGRAAGWLVAPTLGGLVAAGVVGGGTSADLATRAGLATGLGLSVGLLVLAGAAAGRYTRYGTRRAAQQRRVAEQTRRAAALRTERARIAEEIGSGVLAGLHRLVDRTAAVAPDPGPDTATGRPAGRDGEVDLRGLRDEARTVLAAMRRVLGVLRAPAEDPATAGHATAGHATVGPAASDHATVDPAADERAAEGPAAQSPATEGPATEGPAAKSPTAESPAAEERAPGRGPAGDSAVPGAERDAVVDGPGSTAPRPPAAPAALGRQPVAVPRRTRRRVPPLPDQAGLIVLGVLLAVALPLGALPSVRTGDPPIDRLLAYIELPSLGTPVVLLAVTAQFAAIAWWRTAPIVAMLVSAAGSLTAASLGGANLVADTGWLLLVWGAASRAPARWSGPAVLAGTSAVLTGTLLSSTWSGPADGLIVALAYIWVVPFWIAGVLVRRQRRESDRQRRERSAVDDRDAVAQERLRVARDLHDVVAHHVSAIAVQAGAARMAADPQVRDEALAHIAASGRRVAAALPELAGLTPDAHGVVLDAEGVDRLVAASRTAGLPVTVEVSGTPADPPGDPELFAQRILTEALTNVLRHAGPAPTRVRLAHDPGQVSVRVSDDGPVPGHRPDAHGSGLGLVGMRERVSLLGGRLHAGTTGGPGWTVDAVLPRSPVVLTDETRPPPISSSAPIRNDPLGA